MSGEMIKTSFYSRMGVVNIKLSFGLSNAQTINNMLSRFLDNFVVVFIEVILVNSKTKKSMSTIEACASDFEEEQVFAS